MTHRNSVLRLEMSIINDKLDEAGTAEPIFKCCGGGGGGGEGGLAL